MKLHHHVICPFSRFIRLICYEKKLDLQLISENYWQRTNEQLAINPAGELPFLKIDDKFIVDKTAVSEFLEDEFSAIPLIFGDFSQQAKIRQIALWFNYKFYGEVTNYVISEKFISFIEGSYEPSSNALRAARQNCQYHLDYVQYLCRSTNFLQNDQASIADFAAASQISVLDYFGEIPWEKFPRAKEWYGLMKSRPSMRKVLSDRARGISPPLDYENPDF